MAAGACADAGCEPKPVAAAAAAALPSSAERRESSIMCTSPEICFWSGALKARRLADECSRTNPFAANKFRGIGFPPSNSALHI
jgi:hypothetical protein